MKSLTNLKFSVLLFFCTYFFISGVDSYIILPTAWYYIKSLGFSKSFYGVVIAGQSFGFILVSPFVGKLLDRVRRIKLILFLCALIKVTSNLVYAIPVSGYCPLVGYFFSGVANGAYGGMYGEMVRYTIYENRPKLFILVDSMFTIGGACGPIFGAMITFKADILGWKIDDGNSPGIVVAIIWFVVLCVLIFLPSDIGTEEISDHSDDVGFGDENNDTDGLMNSFNSRVWCLYFIGFINYLLTAICVGNFSLITMELFHLKVIHVKLLFCVGMMFVLLVDMTAYIATTYSTERSMLAFSIMMQLPAMILLLTYAFTWKSVPFPLSYSLIIFICFTLPQITFAFVASLLSKMIPLQHASTVQSLLMMDYFVAGLIGRSVSGLLFTRQWLFVFSCGLTVFWLLGATWFGFVFSHLPAPRNKN